MVGFGCDNNELGEHIAPFLLGIFNNLNHELRVVVGASVESEPIGEVRPEEWSPSM